MTQLLTLTTTHKFPPQETEEIVDLTRKAVNSPEGGKKAVIGPPGGSNKAVSDPPPTLTAVNGGGGEEKNVTAARPPLPPGSLYSLTQKSIYITFFTPFIHLL